MRNDYRFKPTAAGWIIQRRWLGCIWLRVPGSGPFGYDGGWARMEWARDMLCAMIRAAAFECLPAHRLRRATRAAVAKGPVLFAQTVESNASDHRAADKETK